MTCLLHLRSLWLLPVLPDLVIDLVRLADHLRAAILQRLRTIDVDHDVALDVLDGEDLVVDRPERSKDKVEVSEKHESLDALASPRAPAV
ncbi:MAG TPA: hypothetical protein VGC42_20965 [Kofleriaceae bacterium]